MIAQIKYDNVVNTFKYKHRSNYFQYFPQSVKTAPQMIAYLTRDRSDAPQLQFVDDNDKAHVHYKVNDSDKFINIIVDHDPSKHIVLSDVELVTQFERLKYLRQHSIHLPDEIEDLNEAVAYLSECEPTTIADFRHDMKFRIKEKIEDYCRQHAQQYSALPAVVDYSG